MSAKNTTFLRFVKFAGSSLIGGSVDMILVWLLSDFVFEGYLGDVIISPLISFECSVLVGFTFCWFYIWNDRGISGGKSLFLKHLLSYNISNIGVFGIRMLLVVVVEKLFGGSLVIINLISRMLAGLLNFLISDKLIFKSKSDIV